MSSTYYDNLYTIVPKATRPTTTVVADPCLELLGLLTESSIEILYEDGRTIVKEG